MKKLGLLLLTIIVVAVALGAQAFAQNVGDRTRYFVTYFSNANTTAAPDSTLRLVNDGTQTTSQVAGHATNGTLWASIYVFDDSQEMQECCTCSVSPDGILSESVDSELISNPLTGGHEETTRGVIKIISSLNGDPTNNSIAAGLRGTMTHVQAGPTVVGAPTSYYVTETQVADANLAAAEQQSLQETCGFVIYLGSGQGVCTCTPEDSDF
jgi:hypothetical protein